MTPASHSGEPNVPYQKDDAKLYSSPSGEPKGEDTPRAIAPCEVGAKPHEWRATVGGPFGHLTLADDGALQVCADCGYRRKPGSWERHAVVAVKQLLDDNARLSGALEEVVAMGTREQGVVHRGTLDEATGKIIPPDPPRSTYPVLSPEAAIARRALDSVTTEERA